MAIFGYKKAQVSHLLPHRITSSLLSVLAILSRFSFLLTEATPLPYSQPIFILITLLPLTTTITISLSASLAGNHQRRPCPLDCQPATTHFGTITSSLWFQNSAPPSLSVEASSSSILTDHRQHPCLSRFPFGQTSSTTNSGFFLIGPETSSAQA